MMQEEESKILSLSVEDFINFLRDCEKRGFKDVILFMNIDKVEIYPKFIKVSMKIPRKKIGDLSSLYRSIHIFSFIVKTD